MKKGSELNIVLLAIGNELLKGETQDKNLYWLGKFLRSVGHHLGKCVFVKDTTEDITQHLKSLTAKEKPDLIILSGGLGPTKDDLTKNALSLFLKAPLRESDQTSKMVTEHYQRLGKTWSPELNYYHLIPEGVTPVKNHSGLAPGLFCVKDEVSILSAPGVPREFKSMVEDFFHGHYREVIKKNTGYLYLRTRGIPEEKIFNEICPSLWKDLEGFGVISSYPRLTGIDILVDNLKDHDVEKIKNLHSVKLLEPYIWQIGNLELEEYIVKLLKEKDLTVATAESCTGGLVASLLTDVAGSSKVFIGSVVSYSNDIKIDELNVSAISIEKEGAVSAKVAKEMAIGAREKFDVDISVATSGIAGPGGGTTEKPVGTIAVGISFKNGDYSKVYQLRNEGRHQTKRRFAVCALLSLLNFIEKM